jgi:8-oxo-dGTP diphosphatase
MTQPRATFHGAKLMLFAGPRLLVIRRDAIPTIPWPGMLDFPGGGREGDETPEACVLRETREELGLQVPADRLVLAHVRHSDRGEGWYFAVHLPAAITGAVVFGDEGAGWQAIAPEVYVAAQDAIPHCRAILAAYLAQTP